MKRRLASIFFAITAMAAMVSCEKEPEQGQGNGGTTPTDAEKVVLTQVISAEAGRFDPYYSFTMVLGTEGATKEGNGVVLEAKLISNQTALHQAKYSPAPAEYAARNNYVTGENGTKLYVNGDAQQVKSGNLDVKLADGKYSLTGTVTLANDKAYALEWAGAALDWGDVPVPTILTEVMTDTKNNGNGTLTIKLSDGKWTKTTTYDGGQTTTTYTGAGNYLAIDLYTADGYLAAGTYAPSQEGGVINAGEFGIGWDPGDIYNIGMEFTNWGTCWWTVDSAAEVPETAEKLTDGTITVALEGKVYTITYDNGDIWATFTGEIPALTKPEPVTPPAGGAQVEEYPNVVGFTDQYEQYKSVIVQFATSSDVGFSWETYQWSGAGKVLSLTINASKDDGGNLYIPTGEYAVNADGAENAFTWQAGNTMWGTNHYVVADGAAEPVALTEGTVWVGAKEGKYIINLESGDYKIRYTGVIEGLTTPADSDGGYVDGNGGGDFNGEVLTTFCSFQSNLPNANTVTVQLAGAGITMVEQDYNGYKHKQMTGAGNYLKFDAYSADGTLAAGTYAASAEGGAVNAGEFSIGYDTTMDWGTGPVEMKNWGTCWMTRDAEGAETGVKIVDGTLTVEVSGDTYTITLQSTALNAQYVGPLQ